VGAGSAQCPGPTGSSIEGIRQVNPASNQPSIVSSSGGGSRVAAGENGMAAGICTTSVVTGRQ